MRLIIGANCCIKLPLLGTKDFFTLQVGITCAKLICPGHIEESFAEDNWIPCALGTALCSSQSKLLLAWARAANTTFKKLVVSHHL